MIYLLTDNSSTNIFSLQDFTFPLQDFTSILWDLRVHGLIILKISEIQVAATVIMSPRLNGSLAYLHTAHILHGLP